MIEIINNKTISLFGIKIFSNLNEKDNSSATNSINESIKTIIDCFLCLD